MFTRNPIERTGERRVPLPLGVTTYGTLVDSFGGLKVAIHCTLADSFRGTKARSS